MNRQAMAAIFKRDFLGYFGNPLGYVIIFFFVVATALIGRQPEFYSDNKANLDLVSGFLPLLLMVFIPLITMSSWSTEFRQGTDQLLLTLPAQDAEVVLAKFAACFGIYTVSLAFTLSLVVGLEILGSPDLGLMLSTYLGYWLLGGALVGVGMLGSVFTKNQALAFILGLIFCVIVVMMNVVGRGIGLVFPGLGAVINELSAVTRYESFTRGVVAFEDLAYFAGLAAAGLIANVFVIGRRHWTTGSQRALHGGVRLASVVVGALSFVLFVQQAALRADVTSARMLSLTPEAKQVLASLSEDRPVTIEAWVSPEVPSEYVATRDALLRMLSEVDARGGDKVHVIVHETELFSEEAERAETIFKVKPERIESREGGRRSSTDVFLGLAFRCGTREITIPFFHRGLPIQYELTRAIGAAADLERSKVGIMTGGLNIFGGFDFQTMARNNEWQVVADLRNQYEVSEVAGTAAIDTSLDVLVVPMPSALPQEQMDRVAEYLFNGGHVLFLQDAMPMTAMDKAPMRPPGAGRNPFQQPQMPEPERGELTPMFNAIGVSAPKDRSVFDLYDPHPEYGFPKEIVFAATGSDTKASSFNEEDPITAGLQELVFIYPGELQPQPTPEIQATTLISTSKEAGYHPWDKMFSESFFGMQPIPPDQREYQPQADARVLAVRLRGKMRAFKGTEAMQQGQLGKDFDAIVVADLDIISDTLYEIRRQGDKSLPELDNVTFIANCIDALAGEEAYLQLRKLRPRHRTLAYFDELNARLAKQQSDVVKEAKETSKEQLDAAQQRLDEKLQEIERREDLDRRTKQVMLVAARDREQAKLDAEKRRIEDREREAVRKSETEIARERNRVQGVVTVLSVVLPVIPVLLIGLAVFIRKLQREREGTPAQRRRAA
jgi:ABC-2 type transport system permease protein